MAEITPQIDHNKVNLPIAQYIISSYEMLADLFDEEELELTAKKIEKYLEDIFSPKFDIETLRNSSLYANNQIEGEIILGKIFLKNNEND